MTNDEKLTLLHRLQEASHQRNDEGIAVIFSEPGVRETITTELISQRQTVLTRQAIGCGDASERVRRAHTSPAYREEMEREAALAGDGIEAGRAAIFVLGRAVNGF